ncbi:MAG: response regulator transcription factor [Planctomycetaceae bacterium]
MDENQGSALFQVLVIEDSRLLREGLCRRIAKKFPQVQITEAGDAAQAMSVLRRDSDPSSPAPDVIVSDLRLPRTDGDNDEIHDDLIELLRRQQGRLILISDFTDEADVRTVMDKTEGLADTLMSKRSNNFEDNVLRRIREILVKTASDRIIYQFQRLYSPDAVASDATEEFGAVSPMSHVFRSEQLAIDYWDYLNNEAQELVQHYYTVFRREDGMVGLRPRRLGEGGGR